MNSDSMFGRPTKPRSWFSENKHVVLPLAAIALLVVLGGAYHALSLPRPDRGAYQAVFLTNGQVYFGKLRRVHTRSPVLDNVFYVQVNGAEGQGAAAPGSSTSGAESASPRLSLVRLGQAEIHQPENTLFLQKSHILFWENLRADSEVVSTIRTLEAQK